MPNVFSKQELTSQPSLLHGRNVPNDVCQPFKDRDEPRAGIDNGKLKRVRLGPGVTGYDGRSAKSTCMATSLAVCPAIILAFPCPDPGAGGATVCKVTGGGTASMRAATSAEGK